MHSSPARKTVLRIPRDPRSPENVFLVDAPLALADRIDPVEWSGYISGLNSIIRRKERASVWNLLRLLLIIPSLMVLDSYTEEVDEYVRAVNEKIEHRGIRIESPCPNGLVELVVVVSNQD